MQITLSQPVLLNIVMFSGLTHSTIVISSGWIFSIVRAIARFLESELFESFSIERIKACFACLKLACSSVSSKERTPLTKLTFFFASWRGSSSKVSSTITICVSRVNESFLISSTIFNVLNKQLNLNIII